MLAILMYIHVMFVRSPITCLDKVFATEGWPRTGVLRVEVVKNASEGYNITHSYEKEFSRLDLESLYAPTSSAVGQEEEEDAGGGPFSPPGSPASFNASQVASNGSDAAARGNATYPSAGNDSAATAAAATAAATAAGRGGEKDRGEEVQPPPEEVVGSPAEGEDASNQQKATRSSFPTFKPWASVWRHKLSLLALQPFRETLSELEMLNKLGENFQL